MSAPSLALVLALALVTLSAPPVTAQQNNDGPRVVEEVLEIDDVALHARLRLPPEWSHTVEFGHTLTAYTEAGGGRALSVTADPNETLLALGVPEFPLFADDTPVESWAGTFAGHPARFFRGRGNARNQVVGLGRALEGTRLVVQLDACIGAFARPVVVVGRSAATFESLHDDPYLAQLSAMAALDLPAEVQPCGDELARGLDPRAIDPPAAEAWQRREAIGLSVALPGRFVWQSQGDGSGFTAQDVSLPEEWFLSVFTERLESADAWRAELPADADIGEIELDDSALASRFLAWRVAFDSADGPAQAVILVSPGPAEDGRHQALVMLSLGQPAARALPIFDTILARLLPAGDG